MVFNHFVGTVDAENLKKRFKELSHKYHPDKNQSSEESKRVFQEMLAEYKYITSSGFISYPITNIQGKGGTNGFNFDDFVNNMGKQQEDTFARKAQAERERQNSAQARRREAFYNRSTGNENFWTTDEYKEAWNNTRGTAQETKEDDFWKEYREGNENIPLIDQVIDMTITSNRSMRWLVFEVYKLPELSFNDFKYIQYAIKKRNPSHTELVDAWAPNVYRNYIACWHVEHKLKNQDVGI